MKRENKSWIILLIMFLIVAIPFLLLGFFPDKHYCGCVIIVEVVAILCLIIKGGSGNGGFEGC